MATTPTAHPIKAAPHAATTKSPPRQRTKKERVASARFNLTLDIHDLRQQIQQLALRRALLAARPRALAASVASPDGSSFLKVERLFQVFNRGYQVQDDAPHAYIEMLTGGVALFEYWRQHTDVFASTRCEIRSVRVVPTAPMGRDCDDDGGADDDVCEVLVEGVSHGAFTISALQMFWPGVLHDAQLTQALLGHAMAKPMSFCFAFDRAGRVVRYTIEPDFHAALALALGGDAARAERLVNGAFDEVDVEGSPRFEEERDDGDCTSCVTSDTDPERTEEGEPDDLTDDACEKLAAPPPTEAICSRHSVAYLLS